MKGRAFDDDEAALIAAAEDKEELQEDDYVQLGASVHYFQSDQ